MAYKEFLIPAAVRISEPFPEDNSLGKKGSVRVEARLTDVTGKTWVVDRIMPTAAPVDITHLVALLFSNAGARGLAIINPAEEAPAPEKPKAPPVPPAPPPPAK